MLAVIPVLESRDALIQVPDHSMVISLQLECSAKEICRVTLAQDQDDWTFKVAQKFLPNKIFIGSSVEATAEALLLQKGLARFADVAIWWQGIFDPTQGTLETLVTKAPSFTHAALILTPDDLLLKRARKTNAARDNVLFELGLFIGVLGRARTFIVAERSVQLPTDMAGVTTVPFQRGKGVNTEANMGPVVATLLQAMGLI